MERRQISMPDALTIVMKSRIFLLEAAKAVLFQWDGIADKEPRVFQADCTFNKIPGLDVQSTGRYQLWLGDLTLRHLHGEKERWFVARTLMPLSVDVSSTHLQNEPYHLDLPFEEVYELRTLDKAKSPSANRKVQWLSPQLTTVSESDSEGKMFLIENPTGRVIDLPLGLTLQIERIF